MSKDESPGDPENESVDQVLEGVARYFSLLSEPTRLRIIHSICETERSVSEIVDATGANQANVSRHLSLLYNAGVLERRKHGNFVFYSVGDPTLTDICRTACNRLALQFDDEHERHRSARALASGFESTTSND